MTQSNRMLFEAWNALESLGQVSLPARDVAFRVALCRNSLRPIGTAIDETRLRIADEQKAKPHQIAELKDILEAQQRLDRFTNEWDQYLDDVAPVQWNIPAKIEARKFLNTTGVRPNDLAALVAVGVITGAQALVEDPVATET